MNEAKVRIRFPSAADAQTAAAALEPDNEGYLDSRVEGTALLLAARSDTIMGVLRSLDDALGCLRATGIE